MACCVLTSRESAGSTAGSLGLSASIILHIRHIMKTEQAERSSSVYLLQHPSLSTPFTSPWQTAQPAAVPRQLTRSAEQISDKLLWPLCLQQWYYPRFQQANPTRTLPKGRRAEPPRGSATQKTLYRTSWWDLTTGWTAQRPRRSKQHLRLRFISICSAWNGLYPRRRDRFGCTLFPGTRTLHQLHAAPQHNLSRDTNCAATCHGAAVLGRNVSGHLPGQNGGK